MISMEIPLTVIAEIDMFFFSGFPLITGVEKDISYPSIQS